MITGNFISKSQQIKLIIEYNECSSLYFNLAPMRSVYESVLMLS